MITVAILINGKPIMARSAVNKSPDGTPDNKPHTYEVDDGGIIRHRRDKGAVALAIKMLKRIQKD